MIKKLFNGLFKFFKNKLFLSFAVLTVLAICHVNRAGDSPSDNCYPDHSKYFYVSDFSSVLNSDTEKFIIREAVRLEKLTRSQIAVVTVPEISGEFLEHFSLTLANKWGIGDKEPGNGILLLFNTDPENRKVRLEVGTGLEGDITNEKAGRILDDYVVVSKNAGLWNKAAWNAFTGVAQELYRIYGLEPSPELMFLKDEPEHQNSSTPADVHFEPCFSPTVKPRKQLQ